jgi:hypothetical protein
MTCPLEKKYGDIICIDGTLWGLTYSECAPPDQRQALGPCEHCSQAKLNWRNRTAYPSNPDLDWY